VGPCGTVSGIRSGVGVGRIVMSGRETEHCGKEIS
jgi:hypothetical protein